MRRSRRDDSRCQETTGTAKKRRAKGTSDRIWRENVFPRRGRRFHLKESGRYQRSRLIRIESSSPDRRAFLSSLFLSLSPSFSRSLAYNEANGSVETGGHPVAQEGIAITSPARFSGRLLHHHLRMAVPYRVCAYIAGCRCALSRGQVHVRAPRVQRARREKRATCGNPLTRTRQAAPRQRRV